MSPVGYGPPSRSNDITWVKIRLIIWPAGKPAAQRLACRKVGDPAAGRKISAVAQHYPAGMTTVFTLTILALVKLWGLPQNERSGAHWALHFSYLFCYMLNMCCLCKKTHLGKAKRTNLTETTRPESLSPQKSPPKFLRGYKKSQYSPFAHLYPFNLRLPLAIFWTLSIYILNVRLCISSLTHIYTRLVRVRYAELSAGQTAQIFWGRRPKFFQTIFLKCL